MQKIKGHDTICTKQVYDTFPNPTSSQWRSLGLHNVKGKGSMERSAGVPGSSWERSTGVPGSSWERMTPGASGFFAPGGSVLGLKEEPCDPIATNVKCGSSYMAISPIPVDLVDVTTSSIDIWVLLDKLRCTFKDPAIESHFNQSSVVENAYKGFISAIFGSGFLFLLAGLTLLYEARYSPEEFTEKIGVVMGLPLSALIEMMFLFMHAGLYGTIIYTKDNVERTQCSRRLSICYVLRVFNITVFTLLFVMYSFYGGVGMEGSGRSSLVMFMIIYVHHVEPVEVVFWGEVVGLVGSVVMAVGVSKAMKAMSLTDMVDITACVIASGLGKYSQRVLMRTEYLMGQVLVRNEQEIKKEMIKAAGLLKAILPSRVIRRWLSGNGSLCDIVESFKHVTVLYLDVVSFTVLSSNISPTRLIAILNTVFTEFDEICQRSKVEKVLQIGDAFMASILEGMSTRTPDPDAIRRSAQTVCSVSLEIQSAVQRFTFPDIGAFQIRVGVHSGSGVGFVSGGESMIKYELVGEVAEIVERVQEVAEPGMVVMTEATKALLDLVRVKCEVMAGRVDGLELFVLKECQKPKDGRSFMTKESVKRKLNPH
ncbi:hypothetical protein BC829DRAFT_391994 [Chytridium lagenaria]|nr:hypothetical protein BC829DRAFT_391994 [Chytridium lagenaria]